MGWKFYLIFGLAVVVPIFMLVLITSSCAPLHRRQQLPLAPHVVVIFRGVKDNHCEILDVEHDAKNRGGFVVNCKP